MSARLVSSMVPSCATSALASSRPCGACFRTAGPAYRPARRISTRAAAATEDRSASAEAHAAGTRRALLARGAAAAVALVAAPGLAPGSAQAFGSGFPGYDINLEGRKRAQERIKREMDAELKRASEFRAAKAAKEAAAAAAEEAKAAVAAVASKVSA